MAGWVWQGIGEWSLPDLCWRRKAYCHHRRCASPSRKCRNTRALCTADAWLGFRSRECEAEESGKISVHALKYDAKCYQHCNSCGWIFPAGSYNIATRLYSRLQTGDETEHFSHFWSLYMTVISYWRFYQTDTEYMWRNVKIFNWTEFYFQPLFHTRTSSKYRKTVSVLL